jgi:hypothetical protein
MNIKPANHPVHFMDINKAARLVRQHREEWRSDDSDYAIARRAEHLYTNVVVMMVSLMSCLFIGSNSLLFRFVSIVLILSFAWFCSRRVIQFREIRRQIEDALPTDQFTTGSFSNVNHQNESKIK